MVASNTGAAAVAAAESIAVPVVGTDEHCGWVLLLPVPEASDHLLCVEWEAASYAHILAIWYPAVTAIQHGENHQPLRVVEYVGGRETSRTSLSGRTSALPVLQRACTGLVMRTATLRESSALSPRAFFDLVDRYRPLLSATAFFYAEFANRRSVGKLQALAAGRLRELPGGMGLAAVLDGLAARNWADATVQPGIIERNRLAELIPAAGYTAQRKGATFGEALKERLLSRRTARWFAPLFAVLAAGRSRRRSICDLLLERAAQMLEPAITNASARVSWRQFNVSRGKCFVECVLAGREPRSVFVVVPMHAEMIARRRAELQVIETLRSSGLSIAKRLPAFTREAELLGHPLFALETLEGRTVDAPVADLGSLTQAAAQLLLEFNRESAREVQVGPTEFDALVGGALGNLVLRYPWARAVSERLQQLLERRLMGRAARVVWLHGDYKVENLVFDTRSPRIAGVLDWELAAPLGLPMLDVLYLLAYDCVTTGSTADLLDAIERHVLPRAWSAPRRAILDHHRASLGIAADALLLAELVFVVHHVGLRFTYDAADPQLRQRLSALLESIVSRLETGVATPLAAAS